MNFKPDENLVPRPITRKEEAFNEVELKNTILRIDSIRILYTKDSTSQDFLDAVIGWLRENKHPDPESRALELFGTIS